MDKVEINVTASGNNFGYAVVELKNNTIVKYLRTGTGGRSNFSYSKSYDYGTVNRVAFYVMGIPGGGTYSLRVKGLSAGVSATDINEASVPDARDFKKLYLVSDGVNLNSVISFYDTPDFDKFLFYVNTDTTPGSELYVRCYPAKFDVFKRIFFGTFYYSLKIYTGTPIVSGRDYRISIPWNTAFGTASNLGVWLYDTTSRDRLPDNGELVINK